MISDSVETDSFYYEMPKYKIKKQYKMIKTPNGDMEYYIIRHDLVRTEVIDTAFWDSIEAERNRHVYDIIPVGKGFIDIVDKKEGYYEEHTLFDSHGKVIFDGDEGYDSYIFVNPIIIQAFHHEQYHKYYNIKTYQKQNKFFQYKGKNSVIDSFRNTFYSVFRVYEQNILVGLIDNNFKVIIEPIFKDVRKPYDRMCAVQDAKTGKWGFYNLNANQITIPMIYEEVKDFSEQKVFVKNSNNKWGVVDIHNNIIFPFTFDTPSF